ncbi:hypothetical protein [Lacipirellula parvula]|uniref:PEP-CTERM protein-sorting domain-containing protein n=1 Tax=Lacipirellula parvula TaxID=2650471 RepID=A0A5K7X7S6_9BACT|nr:hypothetical protein [Lacipirellula parvula]BBO31912.1 hypothetical protein PLANPX_1524 [Lacipirellula parvula]
MIANAPARRCALSSPQFRRIRELVACATLAVGAFVANSTDAALVYSVGDAEVLYTANQRNSLGLNYWADGNLGVVPLGNGQYDFYGANGSAPIRTTGTLANPAMSKSTVNIAGLPPGAYNYVAGGPVYTDPASGKRLMIYHAEKHASSGQDFYSVLGMAISTDSQGLNFRDLGLVVEPDVPMSQRTQSIDVGGGSFAVMNNQLYIYYRDYLEGGGSSELAVARAPLADIFNNASTYQGTSFSKYYDGGWTQPGLGGKSSPLEVGNPGNAWSSVSYNDYLGGLVMMSSAWPNMNGNNDLYMSSSTDGVTWSPRQVVVSTPGEQMYPTLIGTGADPTHTGQSFYAYYTDSQAGAWNRWSDAKLVRRLITLDPATNNPNPNPNPPTPTWTTVADYQDDFKTGGPATGWKYMWNTGAVGDASKYVPLQWSSSANAYNTTGGATREWNGTLHNDDYLMLNAEGGHPGRPGSYTIAGYTLQADDGAGKYRLTGSSIMKNDTVAFPGEDGLTMLFYLNNTRLASVDVSEFSLGTNFDRDLGSLKVGDTIYVMVGSGKNNNYDLFRDFNFTLQKYDSLPASDPNPIPQPVQQWQSVAGFRQDFKTGGPAAGWKYQWSSSGKLGDASKFSDLKWSSIAGAYNTTGAATTSFNGKARGDDYLTLGLDAGHPGRAGFYTIAGYTLQADDGGGVYRLTGGTLSKGDASKIGDEDGLELMVFVNNTLIGSIESILTDGSIKSFVRDLGQLVVGDTIYVMIGSAKNQNYDAFSNFNFTIERWTTVAGNNGSGVGGDIISSIPEPASASLMVAAAVGVAASSRRRAGRCVV